MSSIPSGERLLEQAAFLRALAGSLVWGDGEAEDLVQEACLRALERPPREPGALRSWLARVIHNLAGNAGRSAGNRARRERLAARPEAVPSPAESLARQEELLAVAAAVKELPELLRLAIHLRYYEGLGTREIARRLGEPVDTVKSRLKRALGRLRELLDERHGGERRAWLEGLTPLAGSWPLGGQMAAGAATGTSGWSLLAAWALKGLAMKKLLLAGAGLALLAFLGICLGTGLGSLNSVRTKTGRGPSPLASTPGPAQPASVPDSRASLMPPLQGEEPGGGQGAFDSAAVPDSHPLRRVLPVGLRIQVIAADGVPVAGIPVGLARDRGGLLDLHWQGTTAGEEGLAVVPADEEGKIGPQPALALLLLPLAELVQEMVDPASPSAEPVRLRLPPTGNVRVRIAMAGFGPVPDRVPLSLEYRVGGAPSPAAGLVIPGLNRLPSPGEEEVLFSRIGLGLDLRVKAGLHDRVEVEGHGPSIPGETVLFSLTLPVFPVLVGRLRADRSAPLPARDQCLRYTFLSSARIVTEGGPCQLDNQGDFRISLPAHQAGAMDWRLDLWGPEVKGKTGRRAVCTGAGPLLWGRNDLGELLLSQGELLAAGWVRDREGMPLAGIEIYVYERTNPPGAKAEYRRRWDLKCATGNDGAFQILGSTTASELIVQALFTESIPIGRTISTGTQGVELVRRQEGGAVAGSVRLDPDVPKNDVDLRFKCFQPDGEAGTAKAASLLPDGSFQATGLPEGMSTLEIKLGHDREPAMLIEGIKVSAGETARDPRLQGIDLRGRLHRIEVVLDFVGGWHPAWITVCTGPEFNKAQSGPGAERYRFTLGRDPLDLLIAAEGYPPRMVEGIEADRRVEVDRGIEVVLKVVPASPLPAGPFELKAALRSTSAREVARSLRFLTESTGCFSPDGVASLRVAGPGEYTLRLELLGRHRGVTLVQQVPATPNRMIAGGGDVLVTPSPEALAQAVEEFRKKAGGR